MDEEYFKLKNIFFFCEKHVLIKKSHKFLEFLKITFLTLYPLKKKKHFFAKKMILKARVMINVNPLGPPSRVSAIANFRGGKTGQRKDTETFRQYL